MAEAIDAFFEAWGEPDEGKRREDIAGALASGFVYADPRTSGRITMVDELLDYISAFASAAPGWWAKAERTDARHGFLRILVSFGNAEGPQQYGTYFAELDELGRIELLVGFAGDGARA